ncbi:hypothetical protein ACFLZZ_04170 [Nanoarchaeota archaeon]
MARERLKTYWVEVPELNQKFAILTSKPDTIPGKLIKLDLTRMLKGRSMEANLLVQKEGDKYFGDFVATKVAQSYIKRMMRKNISWIEDSFVVKSKDQQLRVKPFMITKKRIHRSVRKKLRETTKELLIKFISESKTKDVFEAVIRGGFQREVSSQLKKIYPLAFFEIRVLKIEKPKLE